MYNCCSFSGGVYNKTDLTYLIEKEEDVVSWVPQELVRHNFQLKYQLRVEAKEEPERRRSEGSQEPLKAINFLTFSNNID